MLRRPVKSAGDPMVATSTVPAPLGGWNARDSLAQMPAKDAIILDNFFPRTTDISLRGGCELFATIPDATQLNPNNIRGLMGYAPPSGTQKLFATSESGIYDITAGGDISAVSTPSTASAWQSVMVTTAGGSFLWCCNGVDKARYYNGSAWLILDGTSTPSLTGVTSTSVRDVIVFKSRLILLPKDSMSFWYLGINSIAGAASEYPCGELFDLGGSIATVASWSIDDGRGSDDYLCIITTEGEVAVFKGTDPGSTANWSLQGVYTIAKPVGTRCAFKFGGDLVLITVNGLVPMSSILQSATIDRSTNLSDKISQAFNNYANTFKTEFGWQATLFPEMSALLLNIPLGYGRSYQFVMNTITKAWCRFVGWDSEVMLSFGGKLYSATSNKVFERWVGQSDNGGVINASCKTSFNSFGNSGKIKHLSMIRPILTASASLNYSLGVDTDFEDGSLASSASTVVQSLAQWDISFWDNAVWTTGSLTIAKWRSVFHKPSRSLALRLRLSVKNVTVTWSVTDFILKPGGFM